ncbi:hypothetical protein N7471_002434 [Penicillium samsonianum]|uniref:uncharacterized protein n=1 Tax=Penicillium samsonianum TaxID=1882272 RepID=UPI002548E28F|nr:uncharacterized protein N7471_002434 [Penicillium samsonianum]KAJ6142981.1 hypothetical protein N7471_002434 [Penicillium samsonianum]
MDLINRKDEIILIAPTRATTDIIRGNTYYTSLRISLNRFRQVGVSARKTIMIIDKRFFRSFRWFTYSDTYRRLSPISSSIRLAVIETSKKRNRLRRKAYLEPI